MATTDLSDVYVPVLFDQAMQESAIELNRFVQSGVMANDPRIGAMASGPGNTGDLPFYFALTRGEPNYSSDNPASTSTPRNISGAKQMYQKAMQNESWSTMDLSRELALADPMAAITSSIGGWWANVSEKRLIKSLTGVMVGNLANDSGDMVNAIQTETGSTATAANKISAEAFIDTKQTMGDHADALAVSAMHSIQYSQLQKQNLIDYIPDSMGVVNIPTYLGYRVVVDDSMPVRAGTVDGFVYTVMLMSSGSVAYGAGSPPVPSELDRQPASGDGGGEDILFTRQTEIVHPWGFSWDVTAALGNSPTWAEIAADNWTRVYAERKSVGIAFLTCN